MSNYDFDLIVIGGGSGGVRLARWSGGLGAKVAIIEEDRFGGTCVLRGCVPKKMMALGSQFPEEIEIMKDYGWSVSGLELDFEKFKDARDKEVSRLSGLYEGMLSSKGVQVFRGRGVLIDGHTVSVDKHTYTAKNICIAVGGKPNTLNIPGTEHALTSNEMFELKRAPESMIVIGSGYIGLEFASAMYGFGTKITLLCRAGNILRGFDEDIRSFLHAELINKGIECQVSQDIKSIEKTEKGIAVLTTEGGRYEAEACLMATGRVPMTEGLGLGEAGVEVDSLGAIQVNDSYQTSCPSVYALGDVTNRINLTPVATAEGTALAEALFGDGKKSVVYENVPTAVFTHPPLASVGLSEQQARKKHQNLNIYKSDFRNLKMTLSEGGERTFMKMIVDKSTDKVLGCHMVGMDAPEVIQGMAVAIQAGATKAMFDQTIGIHPTSAEEFVTMRH